MDDNRADKTTAPEYLQGVARCWRKASRMHAAGECVTVRRCRLTSV